MSDDEYGKLVNPIKRTEIIEEILREQANLKLDETSKLAKIMRFMCVEKIENFIKDLPIFDSITQLEECRYDEMYDFIQSLAPNIKFTVYKKSNINNKGDYGEEYFVFSFRINSWGKEKCMYR